MTRRAELTAKPDPTLEKTIRLASETTGIKAPAPKPGSGRSYDLNEQIHRLQHLAEKADKQEHARMKPQPEQRSTAKMLLDLALSLRNNPGKVLTSGQQQQLQRANQSLIQRISQISRLDIRGMTNPYPTSGNSSQPNIDPSQRNAQQTTAMAQQGVGAASAPAPAAEAQTAKA